MWFFECSYIHIYIYPKKQLICQLSCIHAWRAYITVISTTHLLSEFQVSENIYMHVNRLVKNPKTHYSNHLSSKPNIYPFTPQASSQECLLICITLLACDMDGWTLGLEEKVIAIMCYLFTELTVHDLHHSVGREKNNLIIYSSQGCMEEQFIIAQNYTTY